MVVRRLVVMFLALAVLVAPLSPAIQAAQAGGSSEMTEREEFLDKWVINGNAIGGALGATLGQYLGTVMFPGPVGWVVGSLVGGLVGGIVGNLIDNQFGGAYNYAAFDRPPIEDGGLVIEGAGTWEQALYQTDLWVVSGGGIMSLVAHFGVNLLAPFVPGGLGRFLSSYVGIFLFDAFFGTIGDNLDGLIDGGKIGAEIDEALENRKDEDERRPRAPSPFKVATRDRPDADTEARRQAYQEYMDHVEAGTERTAAGRAAYETYRALAE